METIKNITSVIGLVSGSIGLITLIFKPVRQWIVNLITRTTRNTSNEIKHDVGSIKDDISELRGAFSNVENTSLEMQKQLTLMSIGVKDVLRSSIIELCKKCIDRGYIEPLEKMLLTDMFEGYSGLGGNSYCKSEYEQACDLPEKPAR